MSIFNRHAFTENAGERLRLLAASLQGSGHRVLSDSEIDSFVQNPEDDAAVREFLFGVDVVSGMLRCDGCGLGYPIQNSIVETVETVETKSN